MLSLAKLAGTDQRYYLDQAERRVDHAESVASGAEDYYLSGPEADGKWMGSASGVLGLRGRVSEASLRAVLSKHDPRTGRLLEGSVSRARVPGFDLMFSVPKSASVLFGIGDPALQRAVLDAQAVAVRSALAYLERHACRTRRGSGGYEIVAGEGFVGAAFGHRTSRAGDPQVHTHVLVANATRIHDGTWGSVDGRAIYAEARTAGFVHEAVFRGELTKRIGVEWTATRNGISEIEGVPREVIDAFSRRKAEIDAQVEAWGTDTAAARQSAALATRRRKDYGVTPDQLAPQWRELAARLGLDARRVRELVGRATPERRRVPGYLLARRLTSSQGLTEHRSSFDRRDVVRAFAEAAIAGAALAEIDAFVDRFLLAPELVPLAEPGGLLRREDVIRRRDGRLVSAVTDSPRYSTVELLSVEQQVVREALASARAGAGVATEGAVDAAVADRPTIGREQAVMVRRLCGEGAGIQVVVGPPGTGKTFALAAAREAWESSGYRVLGAAVARRAAVELTSAAGIEATSVAALLADLRQAPVGVLDDRTVVVVDEAAMLGTRPLAELIERTRAAGSKLVLVGDHAQLPEIEAGGAFRALVARTAPILLETNRRQERETDRRLLDLWRSGQLRDALTIAVQGGDLILDGTPEQAHRRLVSDYCDALGHGEDAIMLAPRRAEVRLLNVLARQRLVDAGNVEGSALDIGGQPFARGDRVVLRRNDRRLDVQNGTRAAVVGADPAVNTLTIELQDGSRRLLPSRYLHLRTRRGGASVEHGYALTAHLAQGMTTDRAFVLGSETVYREWGYVAWSRARRGTRFYAVEPELLDEHHTAAPQAVDRFDEVARRLDRSEAQKTASEDLAAQRVAAGKHGCVIHLEHALGPRPETFRRRRRWDRAARRIERYRGRHAITDAGSALGPEPTDRRAKVAWRKAQRDLDRSMVERAHSSARERGGRSLGL